MTSSANTEAPRSRRACATRLSHPVGSDLALESCSGGGEGVDGNVFVDMHSLCMLAQVIKAREAPRTVALKRSLSRVFPGPS